MAQASFDHEGPGLKCQKLGFDGTAPLRGNAKQQQTKLTWTSRNLAFEPEALFCSKWRVMTRALDEWSQ